jgi:hypothetical protein
MRDTLSLTGVASQASEGGARRGDGGVCEFSVDDCPNTECVTPFSAPDMLAVLDLREDPS